MTWSATVALIGSILVFFAGLIGGLQSCQKDLTVTCPNGVEVEASTEGTDAAAITETALTVICNLDVEQP